MQIERPYDFAHAVPDRFISINDSHLELAAKLKAQSRNSGNPTASCELLDVDCIFAAQAMSPGLSESEYLAATTNVARLEQL